MKWLNFKWFNKDNAQPDNAQSATPNAKQPCITPELTDFIQKHVTEERLEPVVESFVAQGDCGCGCGCDSSEIPVLEANIDMNDDELDKHHRVATPELEVLQAGHKALCTEIEQIMRTNQSSQYDLDKVRSGLSCCVGQWLDCEGKYLKQYQEYHDLIQAHEQFHACTSNMLIKHKKGYFADAIQILRGEFAEASERVLSALQALVDRIHAEEKAKQ